jgi:hypothetical protein
MDAVNFLNLEYLFLRIATFFQEFDIIAIINALIRVIRALQPISILITLFLLYVIIYSKIRLSQIEKRVAAERHARLVKDAHAHPGQDAELHAKWVKIQTHINSPNPSDWRLAILEADIMLFDVLDKMGFQGDSIGEKLKGVKKEDFLTLDLAWEAHKVRNKIAHEGSGYDLSERDAKRIVDLYKKVFEEFYHI